MDKWEGGEKTGHEGWEEGDKQGRSGVGRGEKEKEGMDGCKKE